MKSADTFRSAHRAPQELHVLARHAPPAAVVTVTLLSVDYMGQR
jgi:hypothetical protein